MSGMNDSEEIPDDQARAAGVQDAGVQGTDEEKLRGMIRQVEADVQLGHTHEDVLAEVQQRIREGNLALSLEEAAEIAKRIVAARDKKAQG